MIVLQKAILGPEHLAIGATRQFVGGWRRVRLLLRSGRIPRILDSICFPPMVMTQRWQIRSTVLLEKYKIQLRFSLGSVPTIGSQWGHYGLEVKASGRVGLRVSQSEEQGPCRFC